MLCGQLLFVVKDKENVGYLRLLRCARNDVFACRPCEEERRGNLVFSYRLLRMLAMTG